MTIAANIRDENYNQLIQDCANMKSSTPKVFFFFFQIYSKSVTLNN